MRLLRKRFDVPLGDDPSSRFLAWITALMCYLAALALAGAMMVSGMVARWDNGLTGGLTVQVAPLPGPLAGGADTAPLRERVEAALTILRATPGVVSARPLDGAETSRLLEPWLGPGAAADPHLPVPALIDVATDRPLALAELGAKLAAAAPGSTIDDHAAWLADLRGFARAVEVAALGVMALVGGAGIMAVVFAVRAGLAIHHNVVQLLHLMGATDSYVSRQFESHLLSLSLRGGLGGLGLAGLTLFGLVRAAGEMEAAGLLPDPALPPWQWAVLALVPLTAAALTVVTARVTVLRTLESMP